jgi:leader peptidase (prepilin peptidase)/N-methyltransferase
MDLTTVFFALSGLFVGSFLNVCIDRLPAGRSIAFPGSHCEHCKTPLAWYDNLPVISFLALRGRCRHCGTTIPSRILLVEAFTGAMFGYLGFQHGVSAEGVILALYTALLVAIFFIDLEHLLILNVMVFPATALALGLSPLREDVGILESAYGALMGFGLLGSAYVLARGGLGAGDVKLGAFLGAATGFPVILANLFLSLTSAGMMALVLLLARKKGRKDLIPFGPFLAAGALASLLWGQELVDFYRDLL